MMDRLVLSAFGEELRDKLAVSAAKALAVIERRVAQGARVAPKVMESARQAASAGLTSTPAVARRAALGAADSAKTQLYAASLPQRVGLADTAAATRQRVAEAIRAEAKNPAAARTGQYLSKGYEGYMTDVQRAYSPAHKAQVLGVSPASVAAPAAPQTSHYMQVLGSADPNAVSGIRAVPRKIDLANTQLLPGRSVNPYANTTIAEAAPAATRVGIPRHRMVAAQ